MAGNKHLDEQKRNIVLSEMNERLEITEFTGTYVPTIAQKKLLNAMLEYENMECESKELCEIAGISYTTYIRAMNNVEFVKLYLKMFPMMWRGKANKVMAAMFRFGTTDARCYSDRANFLKITGHINDDKKVDITKKSMNVDMKITKATDDELKTMLRELIKEDPSIVEGIYEIEDQVDIDG